jgi:benzoyl-CoA-dihydrodiol lyase
LRFWVSISNYMTPCSASASSTPKSGAFIITSAKPRMFCSGANIYMPGQSSHAWKVNFCKFTNETRNGIEASSAHSGLRFLAASNGSTAGGGYELALACDEIVLVDDRSASVSLPEVALLGVLPGTRGLTRLTDKRKVRRDLAEVFCTVAEGVAGQRAKDWGLVDAIAKPQDFDGYVRARAHELARLSDRSADAKGVELTPLTRSEDAGGYRYKHLDVRLEAASRSAELTIRAPGGDSPESLGEILAAGAEWWPIAMALELDEAILTLRTNHLDLGLWLLRTEGSGKAVLGAEAALVRHREHWFVREVLGIMRRTFARLDVSSRSMYAIIEPGSCFAGCLLELALAADRVYMLDGPALCVELSTMNFGLLPMVNGLSRIDARFYGDAEKVANVQARADVAVSAREALQLGLVTFAPDELDWADELRLAVESRASLSPDAMTGLEANLRFGGRETMESRIFGRLSAWQNWIFIRRMLPGLRAP